MGTAKLTRSMHTGFTLRRNKSSFARNILPLAATFAVIFFAAIPSRAAESVTREAALRDLAHNVITAGYQDLAAKCHTLSNAAAQLAASPAPAALDQARQSWTTVLDAANRVRCFQSGPIVDHEAAATFYYSRISPPIIEGELQASNALDAAYVAGLGGDGKGVFALEYLLFGHRGYIGTPELNNARAGEMILGANAQRRRAFLLALTRDIDSKATQLAQDWSATGEHDASAKFAGGGQASINLLVNQLAHSIEDANQARLNFALVLPKPLAGQIYRIEASPSGASLQGMVASVEGIQTFYRGSHGLGLADVLKQVNAPLAKRIDEQFDTTLAAIKAIGEPLAQAAADKRDAVQNASDKMKALEILFKVDLASALGVTISFISGDGD